jgi:hypothetical protein
MSALNKIRAGLVGRKITSVAWLDEDQTSEVGWVKRPIVITLDDDTDLIPVTDEEQNDGGVLLHVTQTESKILFTV